MKEKIYRIPMFLLLLALFLYMLPLATSAEDPVFSDVHQEYAAAAGQKTVDVIVTGLDLAGAAGIGVAVINTLGTLILCGFCFVIMDWQERNR